MFRCGYDNNVVLPWNRDISRDPKLQGSIASLGIARLAPISSALCCILQCLQLDLAHCFLIFVRIQTLEEDNTSIRISTRCISCDTSFILAHKAQSRGISALQALQVGI